MNTKQEVMSIVFEQEQWESVCSVSFDVIEMSLSIDTLVLTSVINTLLVDGCLTFVGTSDEGDCYASTVIGSDKYQVIKDK